MSTFQLIGIHYYMHKAPIVKLDKKSSHFDKKLHRFRQDFIFQWRTIYT